VKRLALVAAIAVIAACPKAASADGYPSHVVKIIVPITAGGPLDSVARAIAQTLSERLKQPFIVEDRPGAGGNIGIQSVIASEPDGYTLVVATGSMLTTNPWLYKKHPFDTLRDLRPISTLTVSSQTLAVNPSLPVHSLQDLINYARKNPLQYATSGYGTPSHLTMEYLRMLAHFPATPVTYRGLSALMLDLLSGQVKVGFVATAGALPHVQRGELRAIAVSSGHRATLLPNVPTVAELGYPQFVVDSYILLMAPAHIPDAVAQLLEKEVQRAVRLPDFQAHFRAEDIASVGNTSAESRTWIAEELQRWGKVIKAANMQVN
jgi:tripartite-type tricarboxylate transporter receptor subunit TctC